MEGERNLQAQPVKELLNYCSVSQERVPVKFTKCTKYIYCIVLSRYCSKRLKEPKNKMLQDVTHGVKLMIILAEYGSVVIPLYNKCVSDMKIL